MSQNPRNAGNLCSDDYVFDWLRLCRQKLPIWHWIKEAPSGFVLFCSDVDLLRCVISCLKKVHDIDVIDVFSGLFRTWTRKQGGGE